MGSADSPRDSFEPLVLPREVWGSLRGPRIGRGWEGLNYSGLPTGSLLESDRQFTTIRGVLKLDEDAVVLIGSTDPATRDISCTLRCTDGDDILAHQWKQVRASRTHSDILATASVEIRDALCAADKDFEHRPPSMTLVFSELRKSKRKWHMDCFVPTETFASLTDDIRARRCERLRIAVTVAPVFTNDSHGWPTGRIDIGIVGTADRTFAFGTGWLQSIRWDVARDVAPSVGPVLQAIEKLTSTVRRGFILLLVLLGLVALFRL